MSERSDQALKSRHRFPRSHKDCGTNPVFSVVIISYNTRELTLACLASLKAQTSLPHDIIVVDNASSDGSAIAIKARYPDITVIKSQENLGFALAHDLAVPEAKSDFLVFLNPDTVVLEGALDRLFEFAKERPEAGIWGGNTVFADHSLNPTACYAKMSVWSIACRLLGLNGICRKSSLFNPEFFGGWDHGTERQVDIVTGCLLMIRRDLWNRLGGFDTAFSLYGEDADLCLRAIEIGAKPRVTPKAEIIHYGGASQKIPADKIIRVYRAKLALIARHFAEGHRDFGQFLFRLIPLSRSISYRLLYSLPGGDCFEDKARTWTEVWARRAEWQNGFSDQI